ncbi:hypothetical protein V6N13_093298 [Hibiscus sabdariffa]|uniref:Uncharacterized protein n=2 Tax=Hibiscus sabdariffa TaxID=183260 RepID=A0ABR2C928_9ROSI
MKNENPSLHPYGNSSGRPWEISDHLGLPQVPERPRSPVALEDLRATKKGKSHGVGVEHNIKQSENFDMEYDWERLISLMRKARMMIRMSILMLNKDQPMRAW